MGGVEARQGVKGECGRVFDGWKVVENSAKRVEEGGAAACIFWALEWCFCVNGQCIGMFVAAKESLFKGFQELKP